MRSSVRRHAGLAEGCPQLPGGQRGPAYGTLRSDAPGEPDFAEELFKAADLPVGDRFEVETQHVPEGAFNCRLDLVATAHTGSRRVAELWSEHKTASGFSANQLENYAAALRATGRTGRIASVVSRPEDKPKPEVGRTDLPYPELTLAAEAGWSPAHAHEVAFGAGVSVDPSLRPDLEARQEWLDRAQGAGFDVAPFDHWLRIYRTLPLKEVIAAGETLSQQADRLASWARDAIQGALRLEPGELAPRGRRRPKP